MFNIPTVKAADFDTNQINQIEQGLGAGFNFGGSSTVADLFSGGDIPLYTIIFFFAGFALLIYLVFGGFELMTSAGSPDKASSGKSKITNALIGFIIIFTAYWIVQIVGMVLGLPGITQTFS